MIIKCFRCKKKIDTPNENNADYIIASDTVVSEEVDVLEAIQLTEEGRRLEVVNLKVPEKEVTRTEVLSLEEADRLPGVDRVVAVRKVKPIQKTGIVCPNCWKPTDFVIWGVHKEKSGG